MGCPASCAGRGAWGAALGGARRPRHRFGAVVELEHHRPQPHPYAVFPGTIPESIVRPVPERFAGYPAIDLARPAPRSPCRHTLAAASVGPAARGGFACVRLVGFASDTAYPLFSLRLPARLPCWTGSVLATRSLRALSRHGQSSRLALQRAVFQ